MQACGAFSTGGSHSNFEKLKWVTSIFIKSNFIHSAKKIVQSGHSADMKQGSHAVLKVLKKY